MSYELLLKGKQIKSRGEIYVARAYEGNEIFDVFFLRDVCREFKERYGFHITDSKSIKVRCPYMRKSIFSKDSRLFEPISSIIFPVDSLENIEVLE